MKLHQAFEITPGDVVALIGAGGKTSTMVGLGYELAELGWRVLATTTTRIAADKLSLIPGTVTPHEGAAAISTALTDHRFVFLYDSVQDDTIIGPDPAWIPRLLDTVDSDVWLVEADGAEGLPLKAPYDDEPIIPPETTLVIPVASLSVLGKPLTDEHVYNPQAIINRYGFVEGNTIKSPWVAQVIRDEMLGLRGVPDTARVVAFLNQASHQGYGRARARMVARLVLRQPRISSVAFGSVRGAEPVHEVQRPLGAVVLAGGLSTRMGEPKLLLPWSGRKTIIEHIVEQLIRSRIEHIVVVTGHMANEVKEIVKPMGVKVAFNRSYKTGEMLSSLKTGLRAMPDHVAASLVVLGDQPRIQPKVIYQIMLAYAEGAGDLIIPSYEMKRGHPILMGRRYWPEVLDLKRNQSLRDVINNHHDDIHYIPVNTDSVLRDVDTPDDYQKERSKAGLK
jgi:molybdenum cofactor cytidylyltransferase